jgi:hypothetical protein
MLGVPGSSLDKNPKPFHDLLQLKNIRSGVHHARICFFSRGSIFTIPMLENNFL